jgi:hypothetical protein
LLLPKRESREGTWLPANHMRCFLQLAYSRWDLGRHHCIQYRSLGLLASSNPSRGWGATSRTYLNLQSSRWAESTWFGGTGYTFL